jgi:transposase
MVDTDCRGLEIQVHPASVKDRDGAQVVLKETQARFPFVQRVFADGIYAGQKVALATSIVVEIVSKLPDQVGFQVLPRRWVVERLFAWINRNRRLAKDFEATIASATAFLHAACVMLLIRRLLVPYEIRVGLSQFPRHPFTGNSNIRALTGLGLFPMMFEESPPGRKASKGPPNLGI